MYKPWENVANTNFSIPRRKQLFVVIIHNHVLVFFETLLMNVGKTFGKELRFFRRRSVCLTVGLLIIIQPGQGLLWTHSEFCSPSVDRYLPVPLSLCYTVIYALASPVFSFGFFRNKLA